MTIESTGKPAAGDIEWIEESEAKATMEREMAEFADWMGESRLIFTRAQAMEHMDAMLERYIDRFGVRVEDE